MKPIIILTLILGNLSPCISQQSWFEDNTKWVYDYASFGSGGLIVLECSDEDSIINNLAYNKIAHTEYRINSSSSEIDTLENEYLLFRQDGNQIYRYQNGERKIYDFDSEIGDTLHYMGFDDNYLPILKKISDTIINNESLKYQDIQLINLSNTALEGTLRVIEKIGPTNTFILTEYFSNAVPDIPYYYLKCFMDDVISFSQLNVFGLECDELPIISSNSEIKFESIRIYPNPIKDIFTIELGNSDIIKIKLYSIIGIELRSINVTQGTGHKIDISDLPDGGFLLIGLDKENKIRFSKQILKNGG